jgi:hypothetical protein
MEKFGTARQVTHDNIIWRMRTARWITTATDTLIICNITFPRQQWLRERPSMLRLYLYCPSCSVCHTDDVSIELFPIQNGSTNYCKPVSAQPN